MEKGEQISQEEYFNLTYQNGQPLEMKEIERWKSN
jgi:hypothetical protein